MSQNQPLEDSSSEDEESRVSFTKKELKAFVIQTVHQIIEKNLEPMISRIVNHQFELAGEKLLSRMNHYSGLVVQSLESRTLQLEFMDKLSLPVLTNLTIKGEGPTFLRVALVDATTKQVVTSGIEASAKVEIVVIEGDFDGDNWTIEEFNNKIVKEKEGKKSLLTGNVHLNLEEGIGFVREISFTHNSHWTKVCELHLGAKVADDLHGTRVRPAVTEPFVLKDFRQTYTEKHFPPSLNDEVWRLKKISRDGRFHKRLVSENIKTVKDFLTRFFLDPQSLQNILGTAKMWEAIVDHARTCILDKSLHLYFPIGSEKKFGAVFNVVGQVMGLISDCCYIPLDKLSEDQNGVASNLVVSALEHMEEVMSFADETHLHSHLQLHNDAYPPNSARLESLSHYNCEPSDTYYGHDHTQTNTSSHNNQVVPFPLSDAANPPNIPCTDSLVIMPFAAVDLINDESSLINASEHRFSNVPYANSADVMVLTSQNIGGFDNPQANLCPLDTIPFVCSMGDVTSLDDFGLHHINHLELGYDESTNFHGQVANSLDFEHEDVHLQYFGDDCSLQYDNSCSALHSAVLRARSAAFAQMRWSLVFSVLKWFAIRKVVVAKKTVSEESRDLFFENKKAEI